MIVVVAVLLDEPQDLALAHPRRLGLGVQVALDHVAARALFDAIMRTMSPRYLPWSQMRIGGMRRPSPKCSLALMSNDPGTDAADVGPVAVRLGVGDDLAVDEDRPDDAHVVEVRAAEVGVVDREHVAGVDVARERLDHGLAGEVQRADVHGDVLRALHDRVALARRTATTRSRARRSRTSSRCAGSARPSGRPVSTKAFLSTSKVTGSSV